MRLTKHHGLGNDFLVLPTDQPLGDGQWSSTARRLCDRRRGVGADGLLLLTPAPQAGVDARMTVHNADGSRAEMSGNGIRCLAQALARRRGDTHARYLVDTDAGRRVVEVSPLADPATVEVAVAMGLATELDPPPGWATVGGEPARLVAHLALGNPHTVVGVDDFDAVDLEALGARLPEVNLEVVTAGRRHDEIRLRVHERGVGVTAACGTGACAAAVAAARWGLAAPKDGVMTVKMDGGAVRVRLSDDPLAGITLVGPATFVAAVEVPDGAGFGMEVAP
jgi:diaminopimelate epimerase